MATSGAQQRATSKLGKQQAPNPATLIPKLATDFPSMPMEFSVFCINKQSKATTVIGSGKTKQTSTKTVLGEEINVTEFVETLEWAEQNDGSGSADADAADASLSGSVTFRRQDPLDPGSIPVLPGAILILRVKIMDKTFTLWKLRLGAITHDDDQGTSQSDFGDEWFLMKQAEVTVIRRKNTKRKRKYRTGELIKIVCQKAGVPTGYLIEGSAETAKAQYREIRKPAADLITDLLNTEMEKTGRKYLVRFNDGKFEVRPFTKNLLVSDVAKAMTRASFQHAWSGHNVVPYTRIKGTVRIGKRKKKTVEYLAADQVPGGKELLKAYGTITREKDYGKQDSLKDFRNAMKSDLAKYVKPRVMASVTVTPGLPFLRRGDLIELDQPLHGYKGAGAMTAVTSVSNSLQGGILTTTFETNQQNPYADYKAAQEKKKREEARKKRK